jgi:hypothetical protein
MGHPLRQHPSQVPLAERDDPIETLTPGGPNESFAVRVRLGAIDFEALNWGRRAAQGSSLM